MNHPTHGRRDPLALKPDPARAAEACRALIRAHLIEPNEATRSEVQDALARALAAFHLPPDYVDTEGGRWQ